MMTGYDPTWTLAESWEIKDAAWLWCGYSPLVDFDDLAEAQQDQISATIKMLCAAAHAGKLMPNGELKGRPTASLRYATVSRDALRSYAKSIGQAPAFLFDTLMPETTPTWTLDDNPNRGGRPREYDWDAFTIEIIRIANTPDGLPERQAELINQLSQWCENEWRKQPAMSAIKARVSAIYNAVKPRPETL